jgi:hypothetical protein
LSIKRLNAHERVAYSIGRAIMDAAASLTTDPDRRREVSIVLRLMESILSPEEFGDFMQLTGIVSEDVYDELMGLPYEDPRIPSPDDGPDDEIPF